MNKKIIVAAVLFLLVIFLSGCVDNNEPGRYYNKEYGYSIRFPVGWEKANTPIKGVIVYVSEGKVDDSSIPNRTGILADISVGVMDKEGIELGQYPLDLEQYAERVKTEHKEDGYVLVNEGRGSIGGLDSKMLFFEQKLYGMTRVTLSYFTIVDKNKIYHIVLHTTSDKYPQYSNVFQECLESFRFENK